MRVGPLQGRAWEMWRRTPGTRRKGHGTDEVGGGVCSVEEGERYRNIGEENGKCTGENTKDVEVGDVRNRKCGKRSNIHGGRDSGFY